MMIITGGFTPAKGMMRLVIGENFTTFGVELNLNNLNLLIEVASKMKISLLEKLKNQDEPEQE